MTAATGSRALLLLDLRASGSPCRSSGKSTCNTGGDDDTARGVSLRILFCVLAENANPIQYQTTFGSRSEFLVSWHLESIKNSTTSQDSVSCLSDEVETQPPESQDRVIFMSMYTDIDWTRKDNRDTCCQKLSRVSVYARHSPEGGWCFLGPGDKVVWDPQQLTKWRMELSRRNDDAEVRREWSSSGLRHKFFVKRSIEEQRRWKHVDTLQCRTSKLRSCR